LQILLNDLFFEVNFWLIFSQPISGRDITDDEDKNKSSIEFGQPEPLLIANKKMRIYSSASIAANPMLVACASLSK
jgi:hypothetical protein